MTAEIGAEAGDVIGGEAEDVIGREAGGFAAGGFPTVEQAKFRNLPLTWLGDKARQTFTRLTTYSVALYGTAVLRIGYGSLYLIFLLHEYPRHDALWGPNAPWTPALNQRFANDPGLDWFSLDRWWYTFLGHGGSTWFEIWYHVAILVCLLTALGWRTRFTSACFALTIMAFTGRNVFLTDGGDNIMGLMAIYLAFTRCGARWSLDARRKRRQTEARTRAGIAEFAWPDTPGGRVWAEIDRTREEVVTFLHNAATLVIAAQICVVYAAAGLYKSQGSYWQNGTALYYTLHLDWFRPWPGVSDFMAGQSVMIAIVAYLTVFVQIAFPFAVFSRWLKYPCLVALLGMHFSIAVVMGLPLFSAAMMVGDAVFLPESVWLWIARRIRGYLVRIPVPRAAVRVGIPAARARGAMRAPSPTPDVAAAPVVPATPQSPEESALRHQAQPHKSPSH